MRKLKLMPDYDCFPLWEASPGKVGNVDPEFLPISRALKDDLAQWAQLFDQTLDASDPLTSGFADAKQETAFNAQGRELGQRLQAELGAGYGVEIHSTIFNG